MISIRIGTTCGDSCYCDCKQKCKYRPRYKWHNMQVDIRRWIWLHCHFDIPIWFNFYRKWEHLSGTDRCPFHKSKDLTCWDCKYHVFGGEDIRGTCSNNNYLNASYEDSRPDPDPDWQNPRRCKFFEEREE